MTEVSEGALQPADLFAHFPIPVQRAWDNAHRFCGSTLVFKNREQIDALNRRYRIPKDDVQLLEEIQRLAT